METRVLWSNPTLYPRPHLLTPEQARSLANSAADPRVVELRWEQCDDGFTNLLEVHRDGTVARVTYFETPTHPSKWLQMNSEVLNLFAHVRRAMEPYQAEEMPTGIG